MLSSGRSVLPNSGNGASNALKLLSKVVFTDLFFVVYFASLLPYGKQHAKPSLTSLQISSAGSVRLLHNTHSHLSRNPLIKVGFNN